MDFKTEFFNLVEKANSIVITSHTSPDDDSIGSLISLFQIIKQKYPQKKTRIVQTGERIDRYTYFENYERIEFISEMADSLEDADLLIFLDGLQYTRFSKKAERISKFTGKTICIDHHPTPPDSFDLSLIDPLSISTCGLIYRAFNQDIEITKPLAESLFLGILGDSGNYGFVRPDDVEVFDISRDLITRGQINIQEFQSKYNIISERIFILFQELIRNTQFLQIENWPKFNYSFIQREYLEKGKFSDSETNIASALYVGDFPTMGNFVRTIKNYSWGFTIIPKLDSSCSISLRSLPNSVNVRQLMELMQIGGGHDRAAGGRLKFADPKICLEKVFEWMRNNEPVLS